MKVSFEQQRLIWVLQKNEGKYPQFALAGVFSPSTIKAGVRKGIITLESQSGNFILNPELRNVEYADSE